MSATRDDLIKLTLPRSWFDIPLGKSTRTAAAIRELVQRTIGRADEHAQLRAEGLASAVRTTWKSSAAAKYSQSLADRSRDFTLAAPSTITLPAVVLSKLILVPLSTLPTHHARPRYLAAIFPRALGVLIEIQLTSPDLALF